MNTTFANTFARLDSQDLDHNAFEPMRRKQTRLEHRRRSQGNAGGGIHCRRQKRHTWGCGAGARLADLRAFAGAIAMVIVTLVSSASADGFTDFSFQTVLDKGNANAASGFGSVAYNFLISTYETTWSQYAYFLNNSAAGRNNQYGVYDPSMSPTSSNPLGTLNSGLVQTIDGGTGLASYSVVSGFENRPVNWVNWFSAARFVNWYANGGTVNASTETGSYTLNGQTSGTLPTRNEKATLFLPNANEWTKAAYYNATTASYKTYPTASDAFPTATINTNTAVSPNTSQPNTANFGQQAIPNVLGTTTRVGLYTSTPSTYGAFDMLGNVTEFSDTASGDRYLPMGGSWATANSVAGLARWTSNFVPGGSAYRLGDVSNQTLGFRVAAVPEPGNMMAAAMGLGGLIALHMVKRRKLVLARVAA